MRKWGVALSLTVLTSIFPWTTAGAASANLSTDGTSFFPSVLHVVPGDTVDFANRDGGGNCSGSGPYRECPGFIHNFSVGSQVTKDPSASGGVFPLCGTGTNPVDCNYDAAPGAVTRFFIHPDAKSGNYLFYCKYYLKYGVLVVGNSQFTDIEAPIPPIVDSPPQGGTVGGTSRSPSDRAGGELLRPLPYGHVPLSGRGEPGSGVNVRIKHRAPSYGEPLTGRTFYVGPDGRWAGSVMLDEGPNTLSFRGVDAAGNVGKEVSVDFSVVLPPWGVMTYPAPSDEWGLDRRTSGRLAGATQPGATVVVRKTFGDQAALATAVADAEGDWEVNVRDVLPEGQHYVTPVYSNQFASFAPREHWFELDYSEAPPEIVRPLDGATIRQSLVSVYGRVPWAWRRGAHVIEVNGVEAGRITLADLDNGFEQVDGQFVFYDWKFNLNLTDGNHVLGFYATDMLGNVSSRIFRNVTVSSSPLGVSTPQESQVLNSTLVSTSGSAEPGSIVKVIEAGKTVATAVADAGGSWSKVVPFPSGIHSVIFEATNPAGTISTAARTFTTSVTKSLSYDVSKVEKKLVQDSAMTGMALSDGSADKVLGLLNLSVTATADAPAGVVADQGVAAAGIGGSKARTTAIVEQTFTGLSPGTRTVTVEFGNISVASGTSGGLPSQSPGSNGLSAVSLFYYYPCAPGATCAATQSSSESKLVSADWVSLSKPITVSSGGRLLVRTYLVAEATAYGYKAKSWLRASGQLSGINIS